MNIQDRAFVSDSRRRAAKVLNNHLVLLPFFIVMYVLGAVGLLFEKRSARELF